MTVRQTFDYTFKATVYDGFPVPQVTNRPLLKGLV